MLDQNAFAVLPQTLRFYYLAALGEMDGVVSALDILFEMVGGRKDLCIENIEDLFSTASDLYHQLIQSGYNKESSLLLYGLTQIGNFWGVA